jgi:hypothetical protein
MPATTATTGDEVSIELFTCAKLLIINLNIGVE